MNKIIITLGLFSATLFGAEHSTHVAMSDTDFIPRLINFVIFAGILWYLLADKVKDYYANRSKTIADSFSEVENKLVESKKQKEILKAEIDNAHKKADTIVADAKKESELLKKKIFENAKIEVEMLNKQFADYKVYEESKMKKEVVADYLSNLVKDIHLSSEEVASIVAKKVG